MNEEIKLHSYVLRYDGGAAPNPFWGKCTLVICKPVIRRTAKKDNWIIGTGSKNSPLGDISNRIVYAMEVSEIITMEEYDKYCKKYLPNKIPDWYNDDFKRVVGDCIYDFSTKNKPILRTSVHKDGNIKTDLDGINALISSHYYYFGNNPIILPKEFTSFIKKGPGHKIITDLDLIEKFVKWIRKNYNQGINNNPQIILSKNNREDCKCAQIDLEEALEDEKHC